MMKHKDDKNLQRDQGDDSAFVRQDLYSLQMKYLQRDVEDVKENVHRLETKIDNRLDRVDAKIEEQGQSLAAKIDTNMKWVMTGFGSLFLTLVASVLTLYFK